MLHYCEYDMKLNKIEKQIELRNRFENAILK